MVTAASGPKVHGATVSSFTAVSLDPPLVMVSLNRRSRLSRKLVDTWFGINILAADQLALGLHFAGQDLDGDPSVRWSEWQDAPRLAGCVGFLACAPWAAYDGGDHTLFVGEVKRFEEGGGEPLIFHRGVFRELLRESSPLAWIGSLDDPTDTAFRMPRTPSGISPFMSTEAPSAQP